MQHRQKSRQILTFCDGEMKGNLKVAVGERNELITDSLKHLLLSKTSSNATNNDGRHFVNRL